MNSANVPVEKEIPSPVTDVIYCNNCGARLSFPERGIFPWDCRFCGQLCKDQFDLKKTRVIMGLRR